MRKCIKEQVRTIKWQSAVQCASGRFWPGRVLGCLDIRKMVWLVFAKGGLNWSVERSSDAIIVMKLE